MPSRRDDLLIFLALAAVVVVTVVLAAALPAAPGPARGSGASASEPSSAAFGERDRACAEWTDGCIVCRREGQETACSTPGIACTRGPVQCVKRTGG